MSQSLNTILNGDCTHILPTLPANSIDLIVTDPPYLVGYRDRSGRTIANDRNADWLQPAFIEMYRLLRDDRFAISFYGWNYVEKFMTAWKSAGFRIVGHFVFAKHYASRTGFTEARHECAYLLAKGKPIAPRTALPRCHAMGQIYCTAHGSGSKWMLPITATLPTASAAITPRLWLNLSPTGENLCHTN